MDTVEYYGGTYPDPPEDTYEQTFDDDYDCYMADIMHEEMMLGLED